MAQALHLMNSPRLESKLNHAGGQIARMTGRQKNDASLVRELYLAVFSRLPSDIEQERSEQYLGSRRFQRQKAAEDLVWAMMNSVEFIFNH